MKKIFALFVLAAAFASCESDVKFSDPGFQARKDNETYRADLESATFQATDAVQDPNDGYLTVYGYRGLEIVTLRFPFNRASVINKYSPVTFTLGPTAEDSDDIAATYSYEDNGFVLDYSTGQDENGDSIGNAQISLNEYDNVKQTISGTFKFNAKYTGTSTVPNDNVNFQEGYFYHVPIH